MGAQIAAHLVNANVAAVLHELPAKRAIPTATFEGDRQPQTPGPNPLAIRQKPAS
jgi:hypothetical protein